MIIALCIIAALILLAPIGALWLICYAAAKADLTREADL